jgi:hypothetical protein
MADGRFTEEELAIAKSVDLTAVASRLGYTVERVGRYHTLKEMDSIRIYDRSHWFRWSRRYEKGENGGSQIDFLASILQYGGKGSCVLVTGFCRLPQRSRRKSA